MATLPPNGFGSDTYWNQPASRHRSRRPTRSLSPSNRPTIDLGLTPTAQSTAHAPSLQAAANASSSAFKPKQVLASSSANGTHLQRSPKVSQPPTSSTRHHSPQMDMSQYNTHMQALHAELDGKDEAAMVKLMKSTLPLFSNEHDWEMASFELALILDRV